MKGYKRRRKQGFQKGNTKWADRRSSNLDDSPSPSPCAPVSSKLPIKRLKTDDFEEIVKSGPGDTMQFQDEYGRDTGATILRPSGQNPTYLEKYNTNEQVNRGDNSTYMIVHRGNTLDLFNQAFRDHTNVSPTCHGNLEWNDRTSERRGICWFIGLMCPRCKFTTSKHKLYKEVQTSDRGRKAAAPNVSIQIGMARHGIGPTGIADIITSINMAPPSVSGLHRTACKVADMVIEENERDMTNIVEHLKDINELQGLPRDNPINAEADGTYNNRIGSGAGLKISQPGTQATYLMCEQKTNKKYIISVKCYSNICTCPRKRNGQHNTTCVKNLADGTPIGNEGKYLQDSISDLNNKGLTLKHIIMDGDSNANFVAEGIYQGNNDVGLEVQRCTTHLTRALGKKIKSAIFSDGMFPGDTKKERTKQQSRFSRDIEDRCQAECNAAHNMYGADVDKKKNKLSYIPDTVIKCYSGDCTDCKRYSFVCNGGKNKWKRSHLRTNNKYGKQAQFITPNDNDIDKMRECLQHRLSMKAIQKTKLNATQNKCEASNRGLSKTTPKHMNFFRTGKSRHHLSTHSQNHLAGESLVTMCSKVGAPLSAGTPVVTSLMKKDQNILHDKKRKKGLKYKKSRMLNREDNYRGIDNKDECYKHNMADEIIPAENKKCQRKCDHNYAKSKRKPPSRNANKLD
jgi:hypothetical protein